MCELFRAAAEVGLGAACREGATDVIRPPAVLVATGDIHDNPINLGKLIRLAGMDEAGAPEGPPRHLLLHEIIHSDRLVNGMDLSYRALAKVAHLKLRFPERVHVMLANHELAQMRGAGIVKGGVRVVEAFDAGLEMAFGEDAGEVADAVAAFVRSMALAVRCKTGTAERPLADILCAHSLPGVASMPRFDPTVLDRVLTADDYERSGSAHAMVWGRGYDSDQLEDLVEAWHAGMFILGHEHVDDGVRFFPPNAVILNSDHERGVALEIDLEHPPTPHEAVERVVKLRDLVDPFL